MNKLKLCQFLLPRISNDFRIKFFIELDSSDTWDDRISYQTSWERCPRCHYKTPLTCYWTLSAPWWCSRRFGMWSLSWIWYPALGRPLGYCDSRWPANVNLGNIIKFKLHRIKWKQFFSLYIFFYYSLFNNAENQRVKLSGRKLLKCKQVSD